MQLIADLQLHSKYSRAVSPKMDLGEIARWSAAKGIGLTATGDWTHPLWFREIKSRLREASPGIFSLKNPDSGQQGARFFLSTEISSIYSQGGKTRRIHNLVFSPSISTCEKITKKLADRGANLASDGRPIIGLSARTLLEIVLEADENAMLVPAHIWTPWFSLFGSRSGFDSLGECFGDLSAYIYGIETGLSSDPAMNWRIRDLDRRSILSFSDAHSGPKLGREATVFLPQTNNRELTTNNFTYDDIARAIRRDRTGRLEIGYTIEFFPEEGKYHWSGHRVCGIRYSPEEIRKKGNICPVCGKRLTVGVENRVDDLSSRRYGRQNLVFSEDPSGLVFVRDRENKRRPYVSLIPLLEILAEVNGGSKAKALREYERLTAMLAPEFDILMKLSYDEIGKSGGKKLADAVRMVRERRVTVDPGFDGVFGKVRIFPEKIRRSGQPKLP